MILYSGLMAFLGLRVKSRRIKTEFGVTGLLTVLTSKEQKGLSMGT